MSINPNQIPSDMLRCMGKLDRPKGNAGLTTEEANAKCAKVLESKVQKQIASWLNLRGIVFVQQRMDRKTTARKGLPDFIFAARMTKSTHKGFPVPMAIEVKTLSKMRPEQQKVRSQMEENGWDYYVVGSLEEVKKIVDGL